MSIFTRTATWPLLITLLLLLLCPTLSLSFSSLNASSLLCTSLNQTECADDAYCAYCSSAYSCLPTPVSDSLCTNECTLCYSNSSTTCSAKYPPVTFPPLATDLVCANGGVRAWGTSFPDPVNYPQTRFGGQSCNCLAPWIGADCSICRSNASCTAPIESCNTGIAPTLTLPSRFASCSCTTAFCSSTMQFTPDVSSILFSTTLSPTSGLVTANVNLFKQIPLPVGFCVALTTKEKYLKKN